MGQGLGAEALLRKNISLDGASMEVEKAAPAGADPPSVKIPYTPRINHVFAIAAREASEAGHACITTGHLLLGLATEGEGIAGRVLRNLGVRVEESRQDLSENWTHNLEQA